ncbi:AIM39 (YOL053W) [Zygosaccharomyces parabailii]|nr:AIM39 (YOL053W) [Zygosaccharomyces parabailii]CDH08503.1 probable Altered inheritance of mitochondria protein 39, mitochondrial [Zygosaccharomyces bailii ISA1307]
MLRCRAWRPVFQRWLKKGPADPRYVFSQPPLTGGTGQNGTHFFTDPQDGKQDKGNSVEAIGEEIARQRRQKRTQFAFRLFVVSIASVLGYSIGYKVIYKGEQTFLPLLPASRIRKLSAEDSRRIKVEEVKLLSRVRVLEKLSQHEMIKEQYGVPLLNVEAPNVDEFTMWCEDMDPCVIGLVIEPDDGRRSTHVWYRIPHILKWRLTYRPINLSKTINELAQSVGLSVNDVFQIISPEKVYGSFKYEYPVAGDDHPMHLWFLGEMKLGKDSLIIYKGRYHVDVKLEQIHLLRRENGKLIRYILYKNE